MKAEIVILLGPPGAGKGTQARMLSGALKVPHISTGDMLRDAASKNTSLGMCVKAKMERGELVSDDVVNRIVEDRLGQESSRKGAILDGFPRTIAQAQFLDDILVKTGRSEAAVVNLRVAPEIVVQRLAGRRTCPRCGEIYNDFMNPPQDDNRCDRDGSELMQRADDNEETVRHRMEAYLRKTWPLVEYYRLEGRLREVDASAAPEQVRCRVLKALDLK